MHFIDITIFVIYIIAMLGVGVYFLKRNKDSEDYYVGGRSMGPWHIGLSVVATDVGGGFSIGLGGLGFMMGIAGSWMLFTGLIGAWLSAVVLIPTITKLASKHKFYTFPEVFNHFYNKRVALIAALISGIGYIGFSSSQLLAGAKLASATFPALTLNTALLIMGVLAVVYTGLGGLKAVIYTDTIQWIILIVGLIFIGIPISYVKIGGYKGIMEYVPDRFFSLANVSWQQLVNWAVTIIPIWFVGMTLYQRIYASKGEKEAKKAWFIAGLFEWPVMAFMGVILGLFSRVAFQNGMFDYLGYESMQTFDPEMGLPLLLSHILPVGLMGLMMSAYFSAILSTADSCLMAASGNFQKDIIEGWFGFKSSTKGKLIFSQFVTIIIGVLAILLASKMQNVLELMLYSYAFMVSGLFVPIVGALWMKRASAIAAMVSMISGGFITIFLIIVGWDLPFDLDPNIFGIASAALLFFIFQYLTNKINTN